jgi:phenylalanyl-tRNA synthetase alpha chain
MQTIDFSKLIEEAQHAIQQTDTLLGLEQVHTQYLGKKSPLTALLKSIGQLPEIERPRAGQQINECKAVIQEALTQRKVILDQNQLAQALKNESIDISLPGRGTSFGSLHPVLQTLDRIMAIFSKMGFTLETGPEIENVFYNFEALNIPEYHPSRSEQDTFYFEDGLSLRSQTSCVQIRCMETKPLPLRMISAGKVYRRDCIDNTHTPMFHQYEGLVVDKQVTFSDLKGILLEFLQNFFDDPSVQIRFRPSYFPFVEPGAEVDIKTQKRPEWLEVLGAGMVHPNVFKAAGVDSTQYTGYAFGGGFDRLAMLYYGIDSLRPLFENDINFLKQF